MFRFKYGKYTWGERCWFIHDPTEVENTDPSTIPCTHQEKCKFLEKGSCLFSHNCVWVPKAQLAELSAASNNTKCNTTKKIKQLEEKLAEKNEKNKQLNMELIEHKKISKGWGTYIRKVGSN